LIYFILPDELVVFEAGRVQGQVGHQVVDRVLGNQIKKNSLALISFPGFFKCHGRNLNNKQIIL
jgi:hypothetical protein